ncbi:hypothetical protein CgunFtcFv8_024171 [Champsocephalus gunnari]|uniref:Uncharacterized protein n=1 Tax=Champsocephalus gunnari TaxID=52237 RepID=A0AAN8DBB5_CHAGU|nr:hypothetical protein CgunFtcFv8_024171 [Champsocephalus gunnari]
MYSLVSPQVKPCTSHRLSLPWCFPPSALHGVTEDQHMRTEMERCDGEPTHPVWFRSEKQMLGVILTRVFSVPLIF